MASLGRVTDNGRNCWRIRFTVQKSRKSITLSGIDDADSQIWLKHVEHLIECVNNNKAPSKATTKWTGTLSAEQLDKLFEKGLVSEGSRPAVDTKPTGLNDYLTGYIQSRKPEIKIRTYIGLTTVAERLTEFFTPGRNICDIQATDARRFRVWLEFENKRNKPIDEAGNPLKVKLSEGTIRRCIGRASQFFKQAVEDGLIDRNPFTGQTTTVKCNKDRQRYIELETFSKVLEHAPNSRWRALMVLARLGALRVPSEVKGLRWTDIAWEAKRFTVHSPKTEHHEGKGTRIVPLFPDIEVELLKLFVEAKSEFVFPGIDGNSNLRTTLEKIIKRAGVQQWPKLWQNLRASGATDLARTMPSHVAAEICGHTEQVAKEHYWQVTDSDFDLALKSMPRVCGHNGGHNEGNLGQLKAEVMPGEESPIPQKTQRKADKRQVAATTGNCGQDGENTPGWDRTSGLSFRKASLYPTELRGQFDRFYHAGYVGQTTLR